MKALRLARPDDLCPRNPGRGLVSRLFFVLTFMVGIASAVGAAEPFSPCTSRALQLEATNLMVEIQRAAAPLASRGFAGADSLRDFAADLAGRGQRGGDEAIALCDGLLGLEELRQIPQLLDLLAGLPQTRGSGCLGLDNAARELAETIAFALDQVAIVAQAICDGTSCLPLVCIGTCLAAQLAEDASQITRGVLSVDSLCTASSHAASVSEGFEGAGSTPVLVAQAAELISGEIGPHLDEALSTRAPQEELDQLAGVSTGLADGTGTDLDELLESLVDDGLARAELRRDQIRAMVEEHLRAGVTGRIVRLQIPRAAGGELETVREIVADAIGVIAAAGLDPAPALALFDLGDAALNGGEPKLAFSRYREAYRAAAAAGDAPPCRTCPKGGRR